MAKMYQVPGAVASTSGTSALHVALATWNPDPGSEIITTPVTDMGSIIPIRIFWGVILAPCLMPSGSRNRSPDFRTNRNPRDEFLTVQVQ